MQDLTRFKHTFVSGKTKWLILFAIMVLSMVNCLDVQADNSSTNTSSIDDLTGLSADDVKKAAITDNTFPWEDKSKVLFLYNIKTGKLLNAGGYWGTHASLQEYGMPWWVHVDTGGWIHFAHQSNVNDNSQGNYLEYENTDGSGVDHGVFVDRAYLNNSTIVMRGWTLEAVSNKTNVYKLYTYSQSSKSQQSFGTDKYYLIAMSEETDVNLNCGAVKDGDAQIKGNNDEWKIISFEQIFSLQDQNSKNLTKSIDLTFLLQCPGFSRQDNAINKWNWKKYDGSGNIRFGLEHYNTTSVGGSFTTDLSANNTYQFPDGTDAKTYTEGQDYQRYCGKYFAADIKDVNGMLYQDINVSHGGTYAIECKGYSSTTKAKLFAFLLENSSEKANTRHTTVLGQTSYMSESEQSALHISEQNLDYAAKEFYGSHKYFSSVLVRVPSGGGTIRFGIEVGDPSDNSGTNTVAETATEWTVFDDFRLLYTGSAETLDGDLVLDEDRDELGYLKDCSDTYQNVTLHLNKTFTKDKWNGFILPVDLNRDQLTQAFGPNVRLAQLEKVTDTEIQFKSIDVTGDNASDDEVLMKAYIPYIIFPTKHLELETNPAYTASLSKTQGATTSTVKVIVKKNHIEIPNVSLATKTESSGTTSTIKNDLSKMNTNTWTTNSNLVVDATTGSPIVHSNNKMTAYGTFARTFAPTTTGTSENDTYQVTTENDDNYGTWKFAKEKNIISGRDNLIGSYFFYKGAMYHTTLKDRPRGQKGFSIWFKPTTDNTSSAKVSTYLDEVLVPEAETTGIGSIIYGDDSFGDNASASGRFANGIYTLQGQLVGSDSSKLAELPGGIYIVNGKKVVVK